MSTRPPRLRRWLAVAAGVALVVGGCSSGDGAKTTARGDVLTFDQQTTGTPAADVAAGQSPAGADGGTAVGGPATAAPASTTAPGPAFDPSGPAGSYAPVFLRAAESTRIVIEVRAQQGAEPAQASIDHLRDVLRSVSGKPVAEQTGPVVAGAGRAWSPDDLRALAGDRGSVRSGGGVAVLRLVFVHGSLGGDNSVLGVSVRGDLAAIFADQVDAAGSPITGSGAIEKSVVTHEAGHLLGLVDLYLHTGRQDPDHPGHSTDPQSVMYWAVESNLVTTLLGGGPPADFDRADLADLASIRNGG